MKQFVSYLELTKEDQARINGLCSINGDKVKKNGDFYKSEQDKIDKYGALGGDDNPYSFYVMFENGYTMIYEVWGNEYCYYIEPTLYNEHQEKVFMLDNFYDMNNLPEQDIFDNVRENGIEYIIKLKFTN